MLCYAINVIDRAPPTAHSHTCHDPLISCARIITRESYTAPLTTTLLCLACATGHPDPVTSVWGMRFLEALVV